LLNLNVSKPTRAGWLRDSWTKKREEENGRGWEDTGVYNERKNCRARGGEISTDA